MRSIFAAAALLLLPVIAIGQDTTPTATASSDADVTTSRLPLTGLVSDLAKLKDYRSKRVASDDRPGNGDRLIIAPRETTTVATLEGPGEITHLWTTIATADPDHLRNIVIRIYWDGNDFPSVESPIGDFYGLGFNRYYVFNNPVQAIGTDKGMNCFWPMPFRKSARVEISNESDVRVDAYYFYVDWRQYKTMPENVGYFHAQYRQDFPTVSGKPYLILDTGGGKGHFAGVNLSIHTQVPGWWGEGDDIFTIDGEASPSLWGTGSEDYFCGAWCYGKTFYNDYFGMPLREKENHSADNYWNVYRLHLESPITFEKSLRAEIEHGTHGFDNTRPGRNNHYTSVAYYYVDSPQPLRDKLPPVEQRKTNFNAPASYPGSFEPQYMKSSPPPGVVIDQQGMDGFSGENRKWIQNDQCWVRDAKEGQPIDFTFETTAPLSGPSVLRLTKANDYGRIRVSLNGTIIVRNFNGYADSVHPVVVDIGNVRLPAGKNTLRVEVLGKDEQSKNTHFGIDYLRVGGSPLPNENATQPREGAKAEVREAAGTSDREATTSSERPNRPRRQRRDR